MSRLSAIETLAMSAFRIISDSDAIRDSYYLPIDTRDPKDVSGPRQILSRPSLHRYRSRPQGDHLTESSTHSQDYASSARSVLLLKYPPPITPSEIRTLPRYPQHISLSQSTSQIYFRNRITLSGKTSLLSLACTTLLPSTSTILVTPMVFRP